ncbi:fatty acid desaturase [bacterium]|nr:fatty acid desaturase [bacterium]
MPRTTYSLSDLREEIRAAGLGKPAALKTYAKFLLLIALAFGSLVVILARPEQPWWLQAPIACLAGWLLTGAAMCGHDGAHGATSDRAWVNSLLASLGFTVLGGLSVAYWRHKHNLLHHPNVNVAEKDPDVQQGLLALSTRQHGSHSRLVRWLQRWVQAPVFWLVGAPLVLVDLRLTSLHFDIAEIARGNHVARHLADLGWIACHYFLWLVLPAFFLPLKTVILLYAISTPICGIFLAFIFAPAHVPYPLVKEPNDALLVQLVSTRNFKTSWFFRQTLIGLDRQVEHHIAPKLNHFELESAGRIVRAYCLKHSLPYNETSWLRALLDTHVEVRDGWKIDEIVVGEPAHAGAAS